MPTRPRPCAPRALAQISHKHIEVDPKPAKPAGMACVGKFLRVGRHSVSVERGWRKGGMPKLCSDDNSSPPASISSSKIYLQSGFRSSRARLAVGDRCAQTAPGGDSRWPAASEYDAR